MISLWWSFTLTVIGATGIYLAYRSYTKYTGPAIGIGIQIVWVAYAIATRQWWFILSAAIYGRAHVYGIVKRRRERREAELVAETADAIEATRFTERALQSLHNGFRNG